MSRSSWEINLEEGFEINPEHIKKVCQCRRRVFTTEEDQLIAELVSSQQFTNWHEVAQKLHGRTARQCRDRWTNYLSPSNSFAPWTHEEDELIVEKVNEIGTKWSTIAKFIKGRSDNTIKNRWYSGLKKNCIIGPNGLYILKSPDDKSQPSNKPTTNFILQKPPEGKSTMRVKASPQNQKSKFAYNNPSSLEQEDSQQYYQIQQPQKTEPQLPFSQTQSEPILNKQFFPNKFSQDLSHPQELAFQSRQVDPTIQFQCHPPHQIQRQQEQYYQQIPQEKPKDQYQVSQLLQASLPSIPQTILFPTVMNNQSLFFPINTKISPQVYQQESQRSQIQSIQNIASQRLNFQQPQPQQLQQQIIQQQITTQQKQFQSPQFQPQQNQQKQKQYLFPELEMEMDMETETQAEDSFWDRQIFNQVNDLNKDPFQIPELYGEWF